MKKHFFYGLAMTVAFTLLSISCSSSDTSKEACEKETADNIEQKIDIPIEQSWAGNIQVGAFDFHLTGGEDNKYSGTVLMNLPTGDTQKNKITATAEGSKLTIDVDFECIEWPESSEPFNVSDIVLSRESTDGTVTFVSANFMGSDGEPIGTINENLER